jgi:NAD(P)-dependent dehydrogenase (short-subunit alcohol dehydrogenase family)
MVELPQRVALVTGAASGIGEACVHLLHDSGVSVAALDKHAPSEGTPGFWLEVDVTDDVAVTRACAPSCSASAGSTWSSPQLASSATAPSPEQARRSGRGSLHYVKGVFLTLRAAMPHPRDTRGSAVIAPPVQALATQTDVVAYTTTRGALNAMARAIAVDEAPLGVRVNVVRAGSRLDLSGQAPAPEKPHDGSVFACHAGAAGPRSNTCLG